MVFTSTLLFKKSFAFAGETHLLNELISVETVCERKNGRVASEESVFTDFIL